MREVIAKSLLYATFVKTVTATRLLERMFPIHALYRLITGPTIQAGVYTLYNIEYNVQHTFHYTTLYNPAHDIQSTATRSFKGPPLGAPQGPTSKLLLAVSDWGNAK